MAHVIIHKDGVFNVYTTIADGAIYESGLNEDQLYEHFQRTDPTAMLPENKAALITRVERAKVKGTSSLLHKTLHDTILCNRAGAEETHLSDEDFIKQFLTIRE